MPKEPVNPYYRINVRVSQSEWNKFKKFKKLGLSARKVLELSGCPCDKCKGMNVVVYNEDDGGQILIPRGILTKR